AGPPEAPRLGGPRISVATQPAPPLRREAFPAFPGVTTQPGVRLELPASGQPPLITPTTMPSDMASMLAGLSGNRVQVEVLPDGSLVFIGEPEDIAIWQNFLAQLEAAPGVKPVFRVFQLKNAQAAALAPQIMQIWNQAHQPVVGRARAEDRINVV